MSIIIGHERLTAENSPSHGVHSLQALSKSIKSYASSVNRAFDFMNFLSRMAHALNQSTLKSQANTYLDGVAVCRMPGLVIDLCKKISRARIEPITSYTVADISNQATDTASSLCYAKAFLTKNPSTALAAASVLDILFFMSDAACNALKFSHSKHRLERAQLAPPRIQKAIQNDMRSSLLSTISSIAAIAVSVFACFTLLMGATLVSPAIATTVALTCSVFAMAAYFHKNYWCDLCLKIESAKTI